MIIPRGTRGGREGGTEGEQKTTERPFLAMGDGGEVLLNVLRCRLTYSGQAVTSAEARFNIALRPRKPEGSLGRTAQDVHLDSHTAPEL